MIAKLKNIRNTILGTPTGKTAEVLITRNCRITLPNGEATDGLEGETYTLTAAEARDLVNCQAARIIGEEEAQAARVASLASLLPPPREVEALPAGWDKLPPAFATWHKLNGQALAVNGRAEDIEAALSARRSKRTVTNFNGISQLSPENSAKVFSGIAVGIDLFTEEMAAEERYMSDALQRAKQAANDWYDLSREALFASRVGCSDACILVHGELSRTCRQLAETGKEIFSTRIAALGLHSNHIERLLTGSADSIRYIDPAQPPTLQDLRQLWWESNGADQRFFISQSVFALAQSFTQWTQRNAELTKLLATARAELKKAQAASRPSGLAS